MWHAQERFNSYSKPLINLVSAHILACVRLCLFNSFQFFFVFFAKLKQKNTLNFTMQQILCWGKFKDFSRPYSGIQGLFKNFWQSRTFQGFTIKYKTFQDCANPDVMNCRSHVGFSTPFYSNPLQLQDTRFVLVRIFNFPHIYGVNYA